MMGPEPTPVVSSRSIQFLFDKERLCQLIQDRQRPAAAASESYGRHKAGKPPSLLQCLPIQLNPAWRKACEHELWVHMDPPEIVLNTGNSATIRVSAETITEVGIRPASRSTPSKVRLALSEHPYALDVHCLQAPELFVRVVRQLCDDPSSFTSILTPFLGLPITKPRHHQELPSQSDQLSQSSARSQPRDMRPNPSPAPHYLTMAPAPLELVMGPLRRGIALAKHRLTSSTGADTPLSCSSDAGEPAGQLPLVSWASSSLPTPPGDHNFASFEELQCAPPYPAPQQHHNSRTQSEAAAPITASADAMPPPQQHQMPAQGQLPPQHATPLEYCQPPAEVGVTAAAAHLGRGDYDARPDGSEGGFLNPLYANGNIVLALPPQPPPGPASHSGATRPRDARAAAPYPVPTQPQAPVIPAAKPQQALTQPPAQPVEQHGTAAVQQVPASQLMQREHRRDALSIDQEHQSRLSQAKLPQQQHHHQVDPGNHQPVPQATAAKRSSGTMDAAPPEQRQAVKPQAAILATSKQSTQQPAVQRKQSTPQRMSHPKQVARADPKKEASTAGAFCVVEPVSTHTLSKVATVIATQQHFKVAPAPAKVIEPMARGASSTGGAGRARVRMQ